MFKYILLGTAQGLTEFLPVSSSGHLVILQRVLGISGEEVALTLILHLGSIVAVILFFWKDILLAARSPKTLGLIALATAITGIIGIAGKDFFEGIFSSYRLAAWALVFNGLMLILTQKFSRATAKAVGLKDAFIVGLTQAIAIIPGISRSGMTISTLLFRKVNWQESFKFSFLIFLPVISAATLLEIKKIDFALKQNLANFSAGFIASLLVGLAALWLLKLILRKARFYYFGYYCIIVAIATLLFVK